MWDLVPCLGIIPRPLALGAWSPSHQTTREVPHSPLFECSIITCDCVHAQLLQSCLTLYDPMEPTRLLCPSDFPGNNNGVGCCFLLQGIFLTQGLNPCLLRLLFCRWTLYRRATREAHPMWLLTTILAQIQNVSIISESSVRQFCPRASFQAVLEQPSLEMWVKAFLVWGLQNTSFALLTVSLCTRPMENAWLMPTQVSTLMLLCTGKCHISTG